MIRFLQRGNRATKYFLGGMLLVLCGSMVTYLIPGFMSGTSINRTGVLASVGGQEITSQDVQQWVRRISRQQRYPDGMLPFLQQQAVRSLLQEAELRYEAERMDLHVSDQELRNELHDNPQYSIALFPGGNWIGQDKYEELLRDNGSTVDDFERGIRSQLLSQKLLAAVTAGVTVSPAEIEKAYKEQNTKVKFNYAVIKMEDVEKEIKPTDAELKAFFDANQARYKNSIPETRQVRYFLISEQQAESKVTITPTQLDQYYRTHQESYREPDRVKVRHIEIRTPTPAPDAKADQKALDAARAKAADILKQVKAGGDFAELAKKYSDDPGTKEQGGEIGWMLKGQLASDFEKAAFALDRGQISDVVQTGNSFHIIQTEDKQIARLKPLSEVKDSIEQTLKQQEVAKMMDQMEKSAESDARSSSLDKAAAKFEVQVVSSNPIGRTDSLPGVGAAQDLMTAIFTVDQKAGAQSVRIPQGAVVFQVEKILPPRTPAFDEVKDRVAKEFKSERSSTLLTQKTAELSDRAHNLHDLQKAAKEAGAAFKTSDLVTHTSQVTEVGSMSGAANVAFSLKQGEISGPLNTSGNGVVLQITDRQEPALTGDEFTKAQDGLREQLLGQKRQEVMQLFMSNLEDRLEKEGKLKVNKNEMANLGRGRS